MIEVSQFQRSEAGRKSVESGFNINLIENKQDDWKIIQR